MLLAVPGFPVVRAQVVNRAETSVAAQEQAVELSPFVVTSDQDQGYQAASTLAGSRMNTSLKDTAASISVLTEEFLKDIGALTLDDAIVFGNNVEFDDTQLSNDNATFEFFSTFRIRGQAASVGRNYFRWKLPTNTFNVERIEEARGPNSILFGIASAGGMISTSTKQAYTHRTIRRASLVYGSYDLRRASFDLNQSSLNGKLGVRFNAVASESQGFQHYVFSEDKRGHLALKWNPRPKTVVRAEYERGETHANKANSQELGDNLMKWFNAGRPVIRVTATDNALGITRNGTGTNLSVNLIEESPGVLSNFDLRGMGITQAAGSALVTDRALIDPVSFTPNLGGPMQVQDSWFDTYSAFVEQKVGSSFFFQLAYNHQNYDFKAWQATANTGLKGDPNRFLADGVTPNPHAGEMYFETYWTRRLRAERLDNLRLTASTEFSLGRWGDYRFAGLAEREESNWSKDNTNEGWMDEATNRGAFNSTPSASINRVLRRHYITPGDYSTYFSSYAHPGAAGFVTGMNDPSTPGRKLKTALVHSGTSDFNDPQEQDTYLFAAQAYYLKRKLVFAGGYRFDTLYLHEGVRGLRDPVTNDAIVDNVNNPRANRTVDARTRTYGAVYHVLPWISLRYNQSDSNELANVGVKLMPRPDANGHFRDSRVGDNPQGQGKDYGFDLTLLDGKVYIRATRFNTTRAGAQGFTYGSTNDNPTTMSNRILDALENRGLITLAERDQHQLDMGGSEFDVESKGEEFSIIANPTRNWRLQANYSITDSATANVAPEIQVWAAAEIPYFRKFDQNIVVSTGQTIGQEIARWQSFNETNLSVQGVATIGNRREKVSLVSRYAFPDGLLKGLHVSVMGRHWNKNVIAAKTNGESVYGNSLTRMDASLGYAFGRLFGQRFIKNVGVQLNVYNVLNQHDPLINRVSNPNAAILEINRLIAQEPRYWRLSADLSF